MSANRFKFVSPGIFINEIDQSQLPRTVEDIGPVVIGRAQRGPMMVPVKVQSFLEFDQIFGMPVAAGGNVDYWREGAFAGPTYGAFAAQAYLKSSGPLTYVRLGGFQNPEADDDAGFAGWKTSKQIYSNGATPVSASNNGGAFAMFVAPTSITGSGAYGEAKLAAIFYVDGGTVGLDGDILGGSALAEPKAGVWVKAKRDNTKEFTVVFRNGTTSEVTSKTVSFDTNSPYFIRNALNTTPSKTNTSLMETAEIYWLGQTFETTISNLGTGNYVATIVGLACNSDLAESQGSNFKKNASRASTGWIFAQSKNAPNTANWAFGTNGDFSSGSMAPQKLFKFHTLSEDEWTQKNIKISIDNIKPSTNKYSNFGTFSVVVRNMSNLDDRVEGERFDNCSLDPMSPNFIARKIGDRYSEWDYNEKRFREYGTYANISKYIRVEVAREVEDGSADQDNLPFGFYGPEVYKTVNVSALANSTGSINSANSFYTTTFYSGSYGVSSSSGLTAASAFSASLVHPTIPLVNGVGATKHHIDDPNLVYWGMKVTVTDAVTINKEIPEYLRTLPAGITGSVKKTYSFVFSLDDVSGSLVNGSTTRFANTTAWVAGNRATNSITREIYNSGSEAFVDMSTFLAGLGRFTVPLVGGFEGLDITEKEPFNNEKAALLGDSVTVQSSYAFNSLSRAIDAVADPDVLDMDVLVVPGIKNKKIHQKMISTCENRADSIAVIDLQEDYVPNTETKLAETVTSRLPNAKAAANYVKDTLSPNTSYAATYFPWVQIRDEASGLPIWVPPSVVALGTFASTKKNAAIWFAPAGFNRGGLSADTRPAGLNVTGVKLQLNSKERDALYEVGINPIAQFPSEGVVIFGQKTLQQTPSALDRVNVRRLMNYVKKEISRFATEILFDPNVQVTWDRFLGKANPFLNSVKAGLGITDYRVVLDKTTTTPELVDRNILYAKIFIKPARAIEFIALDFTITNSGASFSD